MENKKIKMPSGNVHDIKYLYVVINALKHKGGSIEINEKSLTYFKKAINQYNDAKSAKYGLTFKPREVNIKIVEHVLTELKNLGLVRKEKNKLMLTKDGNRIALLIENKRSEELRETFTKLMLEKFTIFEYFIKQLKRNSNRMGIPIPFITSEVLDKCNGNVRQTANKYVEAIKESTNISLHVDKLHGLFEKHKLDLIEKRTEKIKKLQSIIEKFVISETFYPEIQSRRAYDFIRTRTTFLGLTNYAIFDLRGFPAEVTYLISDFTPTSFSYSTKAIHYDRKVIYLHNPKFEEIKKQLKYIMTKIYTLYKDEFGYMKIADMRDLVCKELKLPDYLFDAYIKRLYQEESHWISFTYSGASERITEKRLPIVFEKPMRELFTLIKVKEVIPWDMKSMD